MPVVPISLSHEQMNELLVRYRNQPVEKLTYGTVKDFCDSSDHIPFLSHLQSDLKDLQRPAALKAILALLPPGSRILEIGAGEPFVAHILSLFGYKVTIVDPYDGSGNGPIEFEEYLLRYPNLQIVRGYFNKDLGDFDSSTFDAIYSISVLEHVLEPALTQVFAGIGRFLKPNGYSLHSIDHVLEGNMQEFHLQQLTQILALQADLTNGLKVEEIVTLVKTLEHAGSDLDTYYLSAEGHNRWRGSTPYESYRFRKVMSIQSCTQKAC